MPRSSFFIKVVNVGPDLTRKDFDLEHGNGQAGPMEGASFPPNVSPAEAVRTGRARPATN